ncbi:hypothetical protein K1719_044274 [Acacia pycnantha]|nr:hypothetical protein K1719_044274 [Acacia pycnantha]
MDLKLPSKKLRYINWNHYPSESLPLGFYPEKLVEIHLENSKVKKLWDGVQDLKNLRILNLSSKVLEELPDFSRAPNLEIILSLEGSSVMSLPTSIKNLSKLKQLILSRCRWLRSLPELPPSINHLDVKFVHFSLIRAIHNNFCGARVCYPGSTIPKWLRYTQPTSSSITIELARASSDDLLGFICCCLLPHYEIDNDESLALYKMFIVKMERSSL